MKPISDPVNTLAAPMASNADQKSAQQQVTQEVLQLKQQADQQLLQLMLQQKSRLNDMVQQLRGHTPDTTRSDKPQNQQNLVQNLPSNDTPLSTQEEPVVPLAQVSKLQADNLGHLDIIMNRIQQTLQSRHSESDAATADSNGEPDEPVKSDL